MTTIDCQVHVYEPDHPGRPWAHKINGPDHVTGDEQVAAMDALGIDGAVIVSTFTTYRYDSSYAQDVHAQHPGRFALVKPVSISDPAVNEVMTDWASTPGAVGARIMLAFARDKDAGHPGIDAVLKAGARLGMPINVYASGVLDEAKAIVARHPDTTIVIDHVGLPQTDRVPGSDAWADLPKVLALAAFENTRIKLSGACVLSDRPFPYDDIWDPLSRIVDAFGTRRCMWGTDWTRVTNLTYGEATEAFRQTGRFSESDKAMLMGGAAETIYGWSPAAR